MQTAMPIRFFARQKMINSEGSINLIQNVFSKKTIPKEIAEKKIFLIDDSETSILLLKLLLEGYGFTNLHTFTHHEPLLNSIQDKPDLIITDIEMSINNTDGIILYNQLKELGFHNTLFVTAYSESELYIYYSEYINILINNILYKPIQPSMIDTIIKRLE